MYHVAINYLGKQSSSPTVAGETEQKQGFGFVNACIAFCKSQHIIPSVPVKAQVSLIFLLVEELNFENILRPEYIYCSFHLCTMVFFLF